MWNQMWGQARNNREIVRVTPAAPNTTCVITRSQIAMTTTDIKLSAEQMWSTWCARKHSNKCGPRGAHVVTPTNVFHVVRTCTLHKNSEEKARGTHVAARTYQHISTLAIAWQFTHWLHNRNYSKTRPLKLNSLYYSFFLYWPDSCLLLLSFFFLSA